MRDVVKVLLVFDILDVVVVEGESGRASHFALSTLASCCCFQFCGERAGGRT